MKFGPGKLSIGVTASKIDVSCLINGAVITAEKDEGDSRTALCGTVRAGAVSYSWELSGNMDIDPEDADGIFMLSAESYGTEQPFVFTPNTVGAVTATGRLVLDPLDFGNGDDDAFGEAMTSDFAFSLVGPPTYSPTIPADAELDDIWATQAAARGPQNQPAPEPVAAEPAELPADDPDPAGVPAPDSTPEAAQSQSTP